MTFKATVAALAAVCALAAGSANAAVIYSNFGPHYSFDRSSSFPVWGAGSAMALESWSAMAFTSTDAADVTQISLAIGIFFGDPTMEVSLWSKDLTTELGSWVVTAPSAWDRYSATTISGISGIHLDAGAEYALVARSADDAWGGWAWNKLDAMGDSQEHTGGYVQDYSYGMLGAFEVQGEVTPVPEPAVWALLIAGFGGVGAMLRTRRRHPLAV